LSKQRSVLVVDGDDVQRSVVCTTLGKAGYRVVAEASPDEALNLLDPEGISVALIEARLSDIKGTPLLQRIRARAPAVCVIVHTGVGSYESVKAALNGGAFGYVDTPSDPNELLRVVRRAVEDSERAAAITRRLRPEAQELTEPTLR
jgi:DNA-binding NtrC family response regulator